MLIELCVDNASQQWAPWLIGINFNSNREREREKSWAEIAASQFAYFRILILLG